MRYGHWVSIYIKDINNAESFDSYGYNINYYGIQLPNIKNIINEGKEYQGDLSRICGGYCLLYLQLRTNGYSASYFHSLFSNDKHKNDLKILNFYNKLKKKKINCGGQSCQSKEFNINQQ